MITVTDIFAGAGGSSTGIEAVPGVRVATAANHWPLAVAVHAENHQQTEHACVDLHMEDPRNFPRTWTATCVPCGLSTSGYATAGEACDAGREHTEAHERNAR